MFAFVKHRGPAIIVGGVAILTVAMVAMRPVPLGASLLAAVDRLASISLLGAAAMQTMAGRSVLGVGAALAALSWVALSWTTASIHRFDALLGPSFLIAPLLVPLLAGIALGLSTSRRTPRARPMLVGAALAGIGLIGMVRAVVYEPILDLNCWPFCGHNPILLTPENELAAALGAIATWAAAITCGAVACISVLQVLRLPRIRAIAAVATGLIAGGMAALGIAAVIDLVRGSQPPSETLRTALPLLRSTAGVSIGLGLTLAAADRLAVRRRLASVGRLLGSPDATIGLEAMLAGATGDPTLRVGYWTEDRGFLDAEGDPLDPNQVRGQRTELTSRGRPVAMVIHDPGSPSGDILREHLGPQALIALQNDSLQLELRRRVDELRASRRRIVDTGDAERRRLERDLHDGAQQLLLALSLELRRGQRAATSAGEQGMAELFVAARRAADATLDQLRVLAHGIHPAIVAGAGLEQALTSYVASLTPSPGLRVDLPDRLPAATESDLYAIITGLLAAAPVGSGVSVSITRDEASVLVAIEGIGRAPEQVRDRVSAAGGSATSAGGRLELAIPCA